MKHLSVGPVPRRKLVGNQHLSERGGFGGAVEVEVEVALTLQDDRVAYSLPQGSGLRPWGASGMRTTYAPSTVSFPDSLLDCPNPSKIAV